VTFYLKYRSQTVDELDLTEVREKLKSVISSQNFPHAFLFSGPRGTGKTSAARILSKALNCESPKKGGEPCNKCGICKAITKGESLDIVEIDAASHRGIDDIRGLREGVKLAPASSRRKVYIIDEAHMLTTEASNALLKTLEEPPSHVVFILATTNPEKLIDTIRSRTTNINFAKASVDEILRSLTRIVDSEGIKIKKESLEAIAEFSDGSFRDAVKTLEEVTRETKSPSADSVSEVLYRNKDFDANSLLDLLGKKDAKGAVALIEKASSGGVSSKSMISILVAKLKTSLLAKVYGGGDDLSQFKRSEVIKLVKMLSRANYSPLVGIIDPLALEVCVIEWCAEASKGEKNTLKKEENSGQSENSRSRTPEVKKVEAFPKEKKVQTVGKDALEGDDWVKIMSEIRPINASTEALLRASHPIGFDGKSLTLGVYYKFHKEKLESSPHRKILEDVLGNFLGEGVRVVCTLSEHPIKKSIEDKNGEEKVHEKGSASKEDNGVLDGPGSVLTDTQDQDIMKIAQEVFGN